MVDLNKGGIGGTLGGNVSGQGGQGEGILGVDILAALNDKMVQLKTTLTGRFDKLNEGDIQPIVQQITSPEELQARLAQLSATLQEKYGWASEMAQEQARKVFAELGLTADISGSSGSGRSV